MRFALSRLSCLCHVESGTIFGEGTIPEPSTPHIGKGVALVAQAAAPVYPRVYRRSTISDSTNDHSSFHATWGTRMAFCRKHAAKVLAVESASTFDWQDPDPTRLATALTRQLRRVIGTTP